MERIGVRELRQNASRYLRRAELGETIEVTDRGRPVARLIPLTGDTWTDMVASGRVTLARDETDLAAEPPADYDVDATSILMAMRDGER